MFLLFEYIIELNSVNKVFESNPTCPGLFAFFTFQYFFCSFLPRVQHEQLTAIFQLLKENKETFGEVSEGDIEEQLRLYSIWEPCRVIDAHYNRLFLKTTKKLLQYTKWTFLQYSTWLDSALPIFWFIVFYCLDFVVLTTCHPHEGKTKLDWINSHTEQVNIWMNPKRN